MKYQLDFTFLSPVYHRKARDRENLSQKKAKTPFYLNYNFQEKPGNFKMLFLRNFSGQLTSKEVVKSFSFQQVVKKYVLIRDYLPVFSCSNEIRKNGFYAEKLHSADNPYSRYFKVGQSSKLVLRPI